MQKNIRNFLILSSVLIWIAILSLLFVNFPGNRINENSITKHAAGNLKIRPIDAAVPEQQDFENQKLNNIFEPTAQVEPLITQTLPFVFIDEETPEPTATEPPPEPTPTEPPIILDFPTAQPEDIPQWRPALYDIPWAISPNDHFYFHRAIAVNSINWPLANYRYGGMFPGTEFIHTGIDVPALRGTPIIAAADGTVEWAGYGVYTGTVDHNDPYGIAVTLKHDFAFEGKQLYTIYAHMDKLLVQTGQVVKEGEILGLVGDTGLTTGPHLHFEVRLKDNNFMSTVNPELWIAPPQDWGVLVGRVMNTNGSLLTAHDVVVISKATRQTWIVKTYGPKYINSDPYYRENTVLSDLPAGDYQIYIDYLDVKYTTKVTITPGAVTYFSFVGKHSFNHALPPAPGENWSPLDAEEESESE